METLPKEEKLQEVQEVASEKLPEERENSENTSEVAEKQVVGKFVCSSHFGEFKMVLFRKFSKVLNLFIRREIFLHF